MEQETLIKTVAENMTKYRKAANLTQSEVAEKLNYSDKSVSKWEQANGMPDVFVLCRLAEIYGVTINDLVAEHKEEVKVPPKRRDRTINRWMIIVMAVGICWVLAVASYVILRLCAVDDAHVYLPFIYALPVSFIVTVVLSSVWRFYWLRALSSSALLWTAILSVFLTVRHVLPEVYILFYIGIPLQILLGLWLWFQRRALRKKRLK